VAVNATFPGYSNTVRLADCVVPLYEAEIVTVVEPITTDVLTVNVELVALAGTVTLAGTLATEGLLLEKETTAQPLGAGPLNVTVPVEDPSGPPTTIDGFSFSEVSVGGDTLRVKKMSLLPGVLSVQTTLMLPLESTTIWGYSEPPGSLETFSGEEKVVPPSLERMKKMS
jgi:hypothetical protein